MAEQKQPERWLRTRDVARKLSMTNRTVLTLIKEGKIPAKKIGHHWRIPENRLNELLEQ